MVTATSCRNSALRNTQSAVPSPQVLAVLAYAHENDVEPFLEPALHLCTSLMADVGELTSGDAW